MLLLLTSLAFAVDRDGDGYHARTGGDCNDANAAIYPGATEVCNYTDDNCNRRVDEGYTTTWYQDVDRDRYGSTTIAVSSCTRPTGYTARGGDCADADSAINPGAAEVCYDDIDQDCDATDCGLVDVDSVTALYAYSFDSDDDLDGDGTRDVLTSVNQTLAYVYGGPIDGGDPVVASITVDSSTWPYNLDHVETGDVDGDGQADAILSGWTDYDSSPHLYTIPGPLSGAYTVSGDANEISGLGWYYYSTMETTPDVTGDGAPDMVSARTSTNPYGDLVVFDADTSGVIAPTAVVSGDNTYGMAGESVAADTDLDGDGINDLVVGTRYDLYGSAAGGTVLIYNGPVSGAMNQSHADVRIDTTWYDHFGIGFQVDTTGDGNGDGYADLVSTDDPDAALFSGLGSSGSYGPTDAYATLTNVFGAYGYYNYRVNLVGGDFNGDGVEDVATGDPSLSNGYMRGEVNVFYGPASGAMAVDAQWAPSDSYVYFAMDLGNAGVVDGSGADALLVSSYEFGLQVIPGAEFP